MPVIRGIGAAPLADMEVALRVFFQKRIIYKCMEFALYSRLLFFKNKNIIFTLYSFIQRKGNKFTQPDKSCCAQEFNCGSPQPKQASARRLIEGACKQRTRPDRRTVAQTP